MKLDSLAKRIEIERKKRNITQRNLALRTNISNATISRIENGLITMPDTATLDKIANFFNVSVDYLLGNSDDLKAKIKGIKIPVLGVIPAGIPIEAVEHIIDYEEITPEMAKSGEFFGLKVKGDSMMPKIEEGDILIIRKQEEANNGDICAIIINGYDATVKKIKKDTNGLLLVPLNQSYEAMFYSNKDISQLPVRIIGKVVEIRRSL